MKLAFESNLSYQQEAIKSITDLFEGQAAANSIFEYALEEAKVLSLINSVSNKLELSEEQIFENLKTVQERNGISGAGDAMSKVVSELAGKAAGLNFSVEMETGTGKTYVYLRTIYELNKLYGFKKFVIVVPSVAIREGVLKNLEITHAHFQNLYDNVPVSFQVYDSTKVSTLRGFTTANNIEILVINIDSFAKDENIINKANDKLNGQKPIAFIQASKPIVIIDEPQNMETEKRQKAIADLKPLVTLRYSATHKNKYNRTYSLNPVRAYDLGLVKQIEVSSVMEENAFNDAFISVDAITATKTKVTAKITINCNENGVVKKKSITVRAGDDLYKLSNDREIYADGYLIEEIDVTNNCISISNGNILYKGESQGGMKAEIIKVQIEKTIEEHLKKELRLNKLGIKVLSLFFIDKVANYRSYDEAGNAIKGKFAVWFEEIYAEYIAKEKFKSLAKFEVATTHNGYFSQDSKGKVKDTKGDTKADDDTYSLIMRDKEKLLGLDNSLRFIFSHSALREGWDNPNVFQICTLNETKSEEKKRQEIGRGLRLAVNQEGERTYDQNINRLTVIANESYDDFAKALQTEIEKDCGVAFTGRIKDARKREEVKYRKGFALDEAFLEIWDKIKHKTTYRVNYDTADLITEAAKAVKGLTGIKTPAIRSVKIGITMTDEGVGTHYLGESVAAYGGRAWKIPDVLGYIQSKTELTRSTILGILVQSGRIKDILVNPQLFLDLSVEAIKRTLHDMMIDGIKYQKIGGSEYEMALFEAQELEIYLNSFTYAVENPEKTIYDNFIPLDSGVENQFAADCESSEQVKFYFKLPNWFKIPTPIGSYNPDWAIVLEGDEKVYFVAETKDTGTPRVDFAKLSAAEQLKIRCGTAHFEALDDIQYKVVKNVGNLME